MTAILARLNADRSPAVFIADTLENGQLKMWDGANGTKTVGVDYYMRTEPVSDADADALRKRYAKATGQPLENVFLRQRLPRTYRERPNVIAGDGKRSRADAAREQMARDIAQTSGAGPKGATVAGDTVAVTLNVPKADAETLRMLEDPRTAALILKIADTLKAAL
jgi:hypothetical protein